MLWQLIINGLISASLYAMVGAGFAMIYRTAGFFNFAHGAVFTIGAYAALAVIESTQGSLILACGAAVVGSALCGGAMQLLLFRPLLNRHSGSLVPLLASLGVYIVCQNAVSILFGDGIRTMQPGSLASVIQIGDGRITGVQIATLLGGLATVVVLEVLIRRSRFGRSYRALAAGPYLARVVGIDVFVVSLVAFLLASAVAGLAGLLVALDVDLVPTMGMRPLMMGIVAAIIGGMRSMWAIAIGAVILGLAQSMTVFILPSEWQDFVAFMVLLMFLLMYPSGVFGATVIGERT